MLKLNAYNVISIAGQSQFSSTYHLTWWTLSISINKKSTYLVFTTQASRSLKKSQSICCSINTCPRCICPWTHLIATYINVGCQFHQSSDVIHCWFNISCATTSTNNTKLMIILAAEQWGLIQVQWNPGFSNPWFLESPDSLNQKLFQMDLLRTNIEILTPNFRNPW